MTNSIREGEEMEQGTFFIRDRRQPRHFTVDNEVYDLHLGAYALAVYSALSRYASFDNEEIRMSRKKIATELHVGVNTVIRTLRVLLEHNLITVESGKQEGDPNNYILLHVEKAAIPKRLRKADIERSIARAIALPCPLSPPPPKTGQKEQGGEGIKGGESGRNGVEGGGESGRNGVESGINKVGGGMPQGHTPMPQGHTPMPQGHTPMPQGHTPPDAPIDDEKDKSKTKLAPVAAEAAPAKLFPIKTPQSEQPKTEKPLSAEEREEAQKIIMKARENFRPAPAPEEHKTEEQRVKEKILNWHKRYWKVKKGQFDEKKTGFQLDVYIAVLGWKVVEQVADKLGNVANVYVHEFWQALKRLKKERA